MYSGHISAVHVAEASDPSFPLVKMWWTQQIGAAAFWHSVTVSQYDELSVTDSVHPSIFACFECSLSSRVDSKCHMSHRRSNNLDLIFSVELIKVTTAVKNTTPWSDHSTVHYHFLVTLTTRKQTFSNSYFHNASWDASLVSAQM